MSLSSFALSKASHIYITSLPCQVASSHLFLLFQGVRESEWLGQSPTYARNVRWAGVFSNVDKAHPAQLLRTGDDSFKACARGGTTHHCRLSEVYGDAMQQGVFLSLQCVASRHLYFASGVMASTGISSLLALEALHIFPLSTRQGKTIADRLEDREAVDINLDGLRAK